MLNDLLNGEADVRVAGGCVEVPDSPTCDHIADRELKTRLLALHGERIRYHADKRVWLVEEQGVWNPDRHGNQLMLLADDVADNLQAKAAAEANEARRSHLVGLAKLASTVSGQRRMVARASREPTIRLEESDLDANPWLLCCRNGMLDLRTGRLRESRLDDYCTRQVPVAYDPDAQSDDWDAFLAEVQPDREVQAFLSRAVGYSLTGCTSDEAFVLLHGPTATGKSTFLGAIRSMLGRYAAVSSFDTFLDRGRSGQIRNDLARLAGIRFVTALECNRGDRLDAGQLKSMTGGDAIVARFLRQEFFEFTPQFKVWLAANDRPLVPADDSGIWRRILEVPFTAQVSEGRRSADLKSRLHRARPAILKWAVDGCLEWRTHGLNPPGSVLAATADYRAQMGKGGDNLTAPLAREPRHLESVEPDREPEIGDAGYRSERRSCGIEVFWRRS